jgi:CheY-like chemotaxis protein
VRKAADQARAIFAVKSACQRSRGYRPRILHIEADAFSAGLVKAALRDCAELVQAGDAAALDLALDTPDYDLVLFNSDLEDLDGETALHRIAALCPDSPVAIQTFSGVLNDTEPDAANRGGNDHLVNALRTLMLHAMQVPLRAQA